VESVYTISWGNGLSLSTSMFVPPSGRRLEGGIPPDVFVPRAWVSRRGLISRSSIDEDPQLKAALAAMPQAAALVDKR